MIVWFIVLFVVIWLIKVFTSLGTEGESDLSWKGYEPDPTKDSIDEIYIDKYINPDSPFRITNKD